MTDTPADTLVSLFCRRAKADESRTAIFVPIENGFREVTWQQVADDVRRTAATFRQLGVGPGDRVIQVSPNRYEWIVSDLAIHLAAGVHVAVHDVLSGEQITHQIVDSGAKVVILAGQNQVDTLAQQRPSFSSGVKFVAFDSCQWPNGDAVQHLNALVEKVTHDNAQTIEREALKIVRPESLATILYTSGTTGEPKGVMLSHRNLATNATETCNAFGILPTDLRLCFLPLSHIFARTCDLYTWLVGSAPIALAHGREQVIADCTVLRPTTMNGVPYVYQKMHRALADRGEADQPGRLQQLLGGRVRFCCSGGAALPNPVADYFFSQGIPLVQGYGLTESSPVITISTTAANKLGTVGRALPSVEVRIADDGEILTRGPHVMVGYWNKPEATVEAIDDGWLHTGDLGELDADGYLRITGRKKELIVTAGGKNVAPSAVEARLCEDPLIAQAMVIGDGQSCLAALIVPNPDGLRAAIIQRKIAVINPAEALVHPDVLELYREQIAQRLACLARHEQIRRFKLLGCPFMPETGELTPTLKLRRGFVQQKYAREIADMYGHGDC